MVYIDNLENENRSMHQRLQNIGRDRQQENALRFKVQELMAEVEKYKELAVESQRAEQKLRMQNSQVSNERTQALSKLDLTRQELDTTVDELDRVRAELVAQKTAAVARKRLRDEEYQHARFFPHRRWEMLTQASPHTDPQEVGCIAG